MESERVLIILGLVSGSLAWAVSTTSPMLAEAVRFSDLEPDGWGI